MSFQHPPTLSRFFVLLILLAGVPLTGASQQATTVERSAIAVEQSAAPTSAGKLLEIKVPAPSLKGNLLGDPTELNASIYLPPSYESAPTTRYPTLYLLHGYLANNKAWTNGYQGMNLQQVVDAMIRDRKAREMIIVIPNSSSHYGGAFYTNSSVAGNWEDYIFRDLVQHVDANYRTIARAASRGIAGHSMGGYGAIVLGMKHPDVFSAIYGLSPCCTAIEGDMSASNQAWQKVLRLTSDGQLKRRPESFEGFFMIAFVALSASFSPNPEHGPFRADFPFKLNESSTTPGLEKNPAIYELWRSKMPAYMVERYKQNLLKLRGFFIDYGEKEEFSHIVIGAQQFSRALAEQGVPHTFEMYAGGDHGSKIRERFETRVLRFFSETLEFAPPLR